MEHLRLARLLRTRKHTLEGIPRFRRAADRREERVTGVQRVHVSPLLLLQLLVDAGIDGLAHAREHAARSLLREVIDGHAVQDGEAKTGEEGEYGRGEEVVRDGLHEAPVPLAEEEQRLHAHLHDADVVLAHARDDDGNGVEARKHLHVGRQVEAQRIHDSGGKRLVLLLLAVVPIVQHAVKQLLQNHAVRLGYELLNGHLLVLRFLVLEFVNDAVQNGKCANDDSVRLLSVRLAPSLIDIVNGQCHLVQKEVRQLGGE